MRNSKTVRYAISPYDGVAGIRYSHQQWTCLDPRSPAVESPRPVVVMDAGKPCKHRKIKCGEEKPGCLNCERNGEKCDYSIVLNWQGRGKKGGSAGNNMLGTSSFSTIQYTPQSAAPKAPKQSEEKPKAMELQMTFEGESQTSVSHQFTNVFDQYSGTGAGTGVGDAGTPILGHSPPRSAGLPSIRDVDPSLNRIRAQSAESYPSPVESSVGSSPGSGFHHTRNATLNHSNLGDPMPPPFSNVSYQQTPTLQNPPGHSRTQPNEEHRAKRIRMSPATENFNNQQTHQPAYNTNGYATQINNFTTPNYTSRARPTSLAQFSSYGPLNGSPRIPPTPAASTGSEDNQHSYAKPSPQNVDSPNNRRVSIQSLVSGASPVESPGEGGFHSRSSDTGSSVSSKNMYGFDHGLPDLDIPKNKDEDALSPYTPRTTATSLIGLPGGDLDLDINDNYSEFGFLLDLPTEKQPEQAKSYYSRLVKVEISTALGPLPPELQNNKMNLLYFHHFVDHTARILVPYDCAENPFKTILPKMALQDSTLLHLLLAYSAKHRARLLKYPEPAKRIAGWMQDVFPALIAALRRPSHQISDSDLATAIMLASLEIISPAPESDEIKVSWQNHLGVARQMMTARSQSSLVPRDGEVNHFLTRWFAYLDVLGSLSGGRNQPLFHGDYFQDDPEDDSKSHQIDCLMGFTSRCVSILARVAELAHECDNQRMDAQGNILQDWKPSTETVRKAEEIKSDLQNARRHVQQGCHHRRNSTDMDPSYAVELMTTNDAFHWAGLIQLDRRILGKPSTDPGVQYNVQEIVTALFKIRDGGTAEACLLFPMFTAGCDALPKDREYIMARLKSVERSGMFQVRQAISLVEKVWETGRNWETFIGEVEFIG